MKLVYNVSRSRWLKRDLGDWYKDSYKLVDGRGKTLGNVDRMRFGKTQCFAVDTEDRAMLFGSVRRATEYLAALNS